MRGATCALDSKLEFSVNKSQLFARAVARTVAATVSIAAAALATVPGVHAQDAKPAAPTAAGPTTIEAPSQGWTVSCGQGPDGLVCRASQSIAIASTRQLLVALTFFKAPKATAYTLAFQLPHGLLLPAGASVQIDAEAVLPLVIETCDQRGCYSNITVTEPMLASMRKGKILVVTFQNLNKDNVKVQLPLAGFPDALKKI
jgi:invasion protein IalB